MCLLLCADLRAFRQEQLASGGAAKAAIRHRDAIEMAGVAVNSLLLWL